MMMMTGMIIVRVIERQASLYIELIKALLNAHNCYHRGFVFGTRLLSARNDEL
jgi:hypothetical protein